MVEMSEWPRVATSFTAHVGSLGLRPRTVSLLRA